MNAGGFLNIDNQDHRLNGAMNVEFRSSVSVTRSRVTIGGTVKEPLLRSSAR
jgi:hypothetical protein